MTSRNKNLQGWLRRKSQRLHTWSRRWFVLSDKCVFVYAREDDKKSQDVITLDKQIIVEPPVDPSDPKVGYFDIVNEKSPSETVSLCAETQEEKKTWMKALKRALYADKGGALFSQSLEEILHWEHRQGHQIPYIVDECVEYLYKYGLEAEGIFRLGGRMASIKEVIARFERGEKIKFEDENTDVHVVSSVFKTFLRDLPDSIIPCANYQRFMNIALRYMDSKDSESKQTCIEDLASAMKDIPKDNYTILKYICTFLSKVATHEASNKMNSLSIGTIFGPNLIRHIDNENPHLHLCTADLGQHLVHMMLQYFSKVFVLEYSESGAVGNVIPTADLLRMSRIIDVPVAAPRRKHDGYNTLFEDLRGIDLSRQTGSLSEVPSNGSISMVEDFFSAPSSPLVQEVKDDVFPDSEKEKSKNLGIKNRTLHLSLKGNKQGLSVASALDRPELDLSSRPVPPVRTKTKLMRNRRVQDNNRPDASAFSRDRASPRSDSSESVASNEDVSTQGGVPKFSTLPPNMSLSSPEFKEETKTPLPPSPIENKETSSKRESRDGKLGPTPKELEIQVSMLKEEIGLQQERNKKQVTALKSQFLDMQSKYEHCIETMESEFKSQKQELENKLEKEKNSCSGAVELTIQLQEELHQYQMLYGQLPSQ